MNIALIISSSLILIAISLTIYYIYITTRPKNTDCTVSDWINNGSCILNTDGNYYQGQTRSVMVPASGNGKICPSLLQSITCIPNIDCTVSDWNTSGSCIKGTDGNYYQAQTRNILTPSSGGGIICPSLLDQNISCIPNINCTVSGWSTTGSCIKGTDGNYYQEQTRSILTPASGGGTICPSLLTQNVSCTPPINCVVSGWSTGGSCILNTDGKYYQEQTRSVLTQASGGGTACPTLSQKIGCPSPWKTSWSKDANSLVPLRIGANGALECMNNGNGGCLWDSTLTIPPNNLNPINCGDYKKTNEWCSPATYGALTPIDCKLTWSNNGGCVLGTNGSYTQPQTATVTTIASNGGKVCSSTTGNTVCTLPSPWKSAISKTSGNTISLRVGLNGKNECWSKGISKTECQWGDVSSLSKDNPILNCGVHSIVHTALCNVDLNSASPNF